MLACLLSIVIATQADAPFKPAVRQNDSYPLSDQGNTQNWERFERMWDEFHSDALDRSKWLDHNPGWLGRQPCWFDPANVRVEDGLLELTMRLAEPPPTVKDKTYHTYTSAAVQSRTTVLYGYFEIRAKAMHSAGSSSFWFYKTDKDTWTEIDAFEIGAGASKVAGKVNLGIHVFSEPGAQPIHKYKVWPAPFDPAAGFHVYGLDWNKEAISYYVDGVRLWTYTNTYWHQPLTLNFDSETMSTWGMPAAVDLPSTYQIAYVRAWKRAGG